MINLKNLKSIFIEGEDEKSTPTNSNPPSPSTKEKASTPSSTNTIPIQTTVKKEAEVKPKTAKSPQTSIDQRSYERLMAAIEANNLEGFDYLEFKNSLHALAKLPLDESTKFQSAFATAATMGLTMEKLLQSAGFYKSVLEKEKEAFRKALQGKIERDIATKEQERKKLQQTIKEKQEEIKRLNRLIEKSQQKLAKVDTHIEDIKGKVTQARDSFLATYQHIHAKIDKDVANIKKYL